MTDTKAMVPSTCWECSTRCGSLLTVESGRVTKILPNPDHPASRGAFCVKGLRGLPELTYHSDRLLKPLRRRGERGGGDWQEISWDAALDEITERFLETKQTYGAPALAGAVSNGYYSRGAVVALLMRAFGSPNWMINQDLCGGCRAVSDKVTGLAIHNGEDIDNTNCALIVGRNPYAADPVQWQALKRAKERGAKIVTIDPARTPAADIADLWLRPRPGTDAAIAMAMINWLIDNDRVDHHFIAKWTSGFEALAERAADYPIDRAAEIADIPAEDIEKAAALYADGPSSFVSGHGIDAFSAGVQTFRAFHCLVAISGNLDRKGGNRRIKRPPDFTSYADILHKAEFRLPLEIEKQTIGADRFPLWAGPDGWQTACHNPTVIEAMLIGAPYPVRALYVSGVNIAVTYPDTPRTIAALKSLDFVVGAGHLMNPTLALCDIVLPKTTGLEEDEVSLEANGPCLSATQSAHPPLGEARSDFDIAAAVVDRLEANGYPEARTFFPWRTKRDFNRYLLGGGPVTLDSLMRKGFASFEFVYADFEKTGFKTPTGKIELSSTMLEEQGLDPLPAYVPVTRDSAPAETRSDYPLVLLTGARERSYHHSRFHEQEWAQKVSPDPWIQIHPETAADFGINDKDWVEIEIAGGSGKCRLCADVTEDILPGVLRTGMGWWRPEANAPDYGAFEININAATSYGGPWDPATGAADTRGVLCRMKRTEKPAP